VNSSIVLSEVKSTTQLPLAQIDLSLKEDK